MNTELTDSVCHIANMTNTASGATNLKQRPKLGRESPWSQVTCKVFQIFTYSVLEATVGVLTGSQ